MVSSFPLSAQREPKRESFFLSLEKGRGGRRNFFLPSHSTTAPPEKRKKSEAGAKRERDWSRLSSPRDRTVYLGEQSSSQPLREMARAKGRSSDGAGKDEKKARPRLKKAAKKKNSALVGKSASTSQPLFFFLSLSLIFKNRPERPPHLPALDGHGGGRGRSGRGGGRVQHQAPWRPGR